LRINNWLDFVVLSIFTLGIAFIGIPLSLYLLKKGIDGFVKYRFSKLPNNYLIDTGLGTYSLEIICYGLIIATTVFWYLFIDKGGQLFNFINEIRLFWSKN